MITTARPPLTIYFLIYFSYSVTQYRALSECRQTDTLILLKFLAFTFYLTISSYLLHTNIALRNLGSSSKTMKTISRNILAILSSYSYQRYHLECTYYIFSESFLSSPLLICHVSQDITHYNTFQAYFIKYRFMMYTSAYVVHLTLDTTFHNDKDHFTPWCVRIDKINHQSMKLLHRLLLSIWWPDTHISDLTSYGIISIVIFMVFYRHFYLSEVRTYIINIFIWIKRYYLI